MLRIDGKLFTVLSKIGDLFILNVFFILGCLPVVTAGASAAAMYHCCIKCVRRERSRVGKEFWSSFKGNLKQGIPLTIILAILIYLAIVYANFAAVNADKADGSFPYLLYTLGRYVYLILLCALGGLIFPLLSRFNVPFGKLLEMDLFIGIKHLIRAFVSGALIYVSVYFLLGDIFMILFVPAVIALINTFLLEPVIIKYMPRDLPEGTDDWYFEGERKKAEKQRSGSAHSNLFDRLRGKKKH